MPSPMRYVQEFIFAMRMGADSSSRWRLIKNTMRFHLRRFLRTDAEEFTANVRFGDSLVPLTLRTFSGDMFVFYEVLMDQCYRIPATSVSPASVRTIIDCGANIGLTSLYFA